MHAKVNAAKGNARIAHQQQLQTAREGRKLERDALAALNTCATIEDISTLLAGPSRFSDKAQPLKRILQQLKHMKEVKKFNIPKLTGLKKADLLALLNKVVADRAAVVAAEAALAQVAEAAAAVEAAAAEAAAAAEPDAAAAAIAAPGAAAAAAPAAPAHAAPAAAAADRTMSTPGIREGSRRRPAATWERSTMGSKRARLLQSSSAARENR